jgi:hypothetical protein
MRILRAALTYFSLVFSSGFLLGAVRVPFLVPRLGQRTAELLEMPFMAMAMVLAARFIGHHHLPAAGPGPRVAAGFLALTLMITAELGVGIGLEHRSLPAIITGRDPISGSVYLAMLLLYALLPLLIRPDDRSTVIQRQSPSVATSGSGKPVD